MIKKQQSMLFFVITVLTKGRLNGNKKQMANFYENLPDTPGVYLMKNKKGELLYVGKAAHLRRRVSSYFLKSHESRIAKLVSEIAKIDYIKTDTAIEALILEADLIKKHQPPYNIREKDDKTFPYIEITKEKFPRVILVRGKDKENGIRFGPFTNSTHAKLALKIIRRIFPYSIHPPEKVGTYKKPCFEAEIGLCPGTCIGGITKEEYMKNIKSIKMFLKGEKEKIIAGLEKEMLEYSKKLEYERAAAVKKKLFSLRHIQDVAFITADDFSESGGYRIECFDISNISGEDAVGSMVVFKGSKPLKEDYRIFKIKSVREPNDVAMMKETIMRRLKHDEWTYPDLIMVDGGPTQINAAKDAMNEVGVIIPVVGVVKGPKRKKADIVGVLPFEVDDKTVAHIRDEAHRFAIKHHRILRGKEFAK